MNAGLSNNLSAHIWWYLDAVPRHAWNRWRYHHPLAAFIDQHVPVKGAASPDDPALASYWAERRKKVQPPLDTYSLRLLARQDGRCPAGLLTDQGRAAAMTSGAFDRRAPVGLYAECSTMGTIVILFVYFLTNRANRQEIDADAGSKPTTPDYRRREANQAAHQPIKIETPAVVARVGAADDHRPADPVPARCQPTVRVGPGLGFRRLGSTSRPSTPGTRRDATAAVPTAAVDALFIKAVVTEEEARGGGTGRAWRAAAVQLGGRRKDAANRPGPRLGVLAAPLRGDEITVITVPFCAWLPLRGDDCGPANAYDPGAAAYDRSTMAGSWSGKGGGSTDATVAVFHCQRRPRNRRPAVARVQKSRHARPSHSPSCHDLNDGPTREHCQQSSPQRPQAGSHHRPTQGAVEPTAY